MGKSKPDGTIEVRRDSDGRISLTCIVPGHSGWLISRATLPEALRVLAENLDRKPTETPKRRAFTKSMGEA